MSRKRGGYIGGSGVITVRHSDKRMAQRQAHWDRKLGRDKIEQCVSGVADNDPPRLIKRAETKS